MTLSKLSALLSEWRNSIATRLTLRYGLLAVVAVVVVLTIFYFQTISILQVQFSRQIDAIARSLESRASQSGQPALIDEINALLKDSVDVDTEIFLLMDPNGQVLAGNIDPASVRHVDGALLETGEQSINRLGKPINGYIQVNLQRDKSVLVVGKDTRDLKHIETLLSQAGLSVAIVAFMGVFIGTYFFRHELQLHVSGIRRTAMLVGAGELQQRVPASDNGDEFARLTADINHMLDRIEALMQGVRNVSDSVSHNIRTPLTRVLARLRTVRDATPSPDTPTLLNANKAAIVELEDMTIMVDKLLQIAEAESGMQRQHFRTTRLDHLAADVIDLYAVIAEEKGMTLTLSAATAVAVEGDADLLVDVIANLVENALKQADLGARHVQLQVDAGADGMAQLTVADDGLGVTDEQLLRLGSRFYRANPDLPGYGLGLASVRAIVQLHAGSVVFEHAHPGLRVRISLPTSTL